MDKQLILSDSQSLIAAAGTFNSTNVIDLWNGKTSPEAGPLGTPTWDPAEGQPLEVLIQIVETFLAAAGAATLQVKIINADAADLTGNPITVFDSGAIAKATLVAGYRFAIRAIPIGLITRRYLGLTITIATNPGTAGKLLAAFGSAGFQHV